MDREQIIQTRLSLEDLLIQIQIEIQNTPENKLLLDACTHLKISVEEYRKATINLDYYYRSGRP